MRLAAEEKIQQSDQKKMDEMMFNHLKKRCDELIEAHPQKRALFERYISSRRTKFWRPECRV